MSGMGVTPTYSVKKFLESNGPLVDVRSPIEFIQGHLPGAINLPLFSNDQRKEIGTTFKIKGRGEAIQLGLRYIGPEMHSLANQLKKIARKGSQNDDDQSPIKIYCWRGGMRSSSVAWLANLVDLNPLLLEGGYKSYRRWVLQLFEDKLPLKLLGGKTGTGKTDLLVAMASKSVAVIDLEGLANHRGSSFGALGLPEQPTSEQYENLLAKEISFFLSTGSKEIWLEAESSHLGKCRIPHTLLRQMKVAPVFEITRSENERVTNLVKVYSPYGIKKLTEATLRISRRLGPQRTKKALEAISKENWHDACIEIIDYYDRCYDHELSKAKNHKCVDISGLGPNAAAEKLLSIGI